MQDGRARAHARRGDQTVQSLADRHTCAPGATVKLRCQSEVLQTVETQHRKYLQVTFDEARFSVRAKALEDLGEHDVGERDRLSPLDQLDATQRLRRVSVVQNVDPDARVDDDHERPRRLSSRSPSQRTRPRRSSTPMRRWRATSSRNATSTASRFVRAPISSWASWSTRSSISMFVLIHHSIHIQGCTY